MRIRSLLVSAVFLAACSKADAPPAVDTTAMAPPAAPAMSMASLAGMWNVNVMPMDRDTVVASYVLNAMDSTAWTFTFTGRTEAIQMRSTGSSGGTLLTEAGPFDSGVRSGQKVSVKTKSWMQDGKMMTLWTRTTRDSCRLHRQASQRRDPPVVTGARGSQVIHWLPTRLV